MVVKTVKDYYNDMYKLFPDVPKEDVRRALNYGWKCLYLYNSRGADTIIKDKSFWCYIGYLKKNSLDYFSYYIKKLALKLRILYQRKKIKWDYYYYFALDDSQYKDYISQKNSKGRKRKKFTFHKVVLYQILDECKIRDSGKKYIFRIPYITNIGFTIYRDTLITDKAELIIEREPLKFKDVLITDNEYDVL